MEIDVAAVAPLLLLILGLLMPKAIFALRKWFKPSTAERDSLISTVGHALSCALLCKVGRDQEPSVLLVYKLLHETQANSSRLEFVSKHAVMHNCYKNRSAQYCPGCLYIWHAFWNGLNTSCQRSSKYTILWFLPQLWETSDMMCA